VNPPSLHAAVFDFDGTLFDATGAIVHAFNAALRAYGCPELPAERILPLIGRPLFEMFPALEPSARGARTDAFIAAYREAFGPVCVEMTRPLPGLTAALDALTRAGLKLAIATNRSEGGARAILRGFGMELRFEAIVALEHVDQVKPHPEPVYKACAALGVPVGAAAMIGDTPDDMRAGRAAGAWVVGVETGVHPAAALAAAGAHIVIPTLESLPAALGLPG
jgi:2-phosphoglycolate phosphatase